MAQSLTNTKTIAMGAIAISRKALMDSAASFDRATLSRPSAPQQFGNIQVALPVSNIFPDDFTITCDNSAGLTPAVYVVGDPIGWHRIYYGGVTVDPTFNYQGLTNTTLRNFMLLGVQLRFTGLNLTASVSSSQFNQPFDVVSGIYNQFTTKSITNALNEAENPMAQNPLLLKPVFGEGVYLPLDANNSYFVTVEAGEKLSIKCKIGKASDLYTQSLADLSI